MFNCLIIILVIVNIDIPKKFYDLCDRMMMDLRFFLLQRIILSHRTDVAGQLIEISNEGLACLNYNRSGIKG